MHEIKFNNVYNFWNNALPLGNGRMGAMVFFENHEMHIAMNHYDCYYDLFTPSIEQKSKPTAKSKPPQTYETLSEMFGTLRHDPDYQYDHYIKQFNPQAGSIRPQYNTTSYPMSGEIVIKLDPSLDVFSLTLNINAATVHFEASSSDGSKKTSMIVWIAKNMDGLIAQTTQSHSGLWSEATLMLPSQIGQARYEYVMGSDEMNKWMRSSYDGKLAETLITQQDDMLVATIAPQHGISAKQNLKLIQKVGTLRVSHQSYWSDFWQTTVRLPDSFLETLWHLHMYVLDCASGIHGKFFEQACGLCGLWDIRKPNLWGSSWYWDVNIQEAFWPIFSSNKMDLAKHFCDAYLFHQPKIEAFTKRMYNTNGFSLDFPFFLYQCIQPWTAQFLWRYYAYTGDVQYLKEKIYPVFLKQIEQFKHIATRDENGIYHLDFDISPEQGPISKDSIISIASMKQLIKYAIKAAAVLNQTQDIPELETLLNKLPAYARTTDDTRWKDSAFAPDDLFLRHPSVLMPMFPAEEVDKFSESGTKNLAMITLKFAIENTEIGAFGAGWFAAAAASLGEGDAAIRIIYEKGIDYFIHSNGLGYEESERYVNHCLITKPILYPPAQMEPSGGMVMTLNQMLLYSGEHIEVFPAIPGGIDQLKTRKAQYHYHNNALQGKYPAWDDCEFTNMRAAGGFIISAQRTFGKTNWISVTASFDAPLTLMLPEHLRKKPDELYFHAIMKAGEQLEFGKKAKTCSNTIPLNTSNKAQVHQAATTGRRIFLGEDRHTSFFQAVDSFLCPFMQGSTHQQHMIPYIFDFTANQTHKNYDAVFHMSYVQSGNALVYFGAPKAHGVMLYDTHLGYGFAHTKDLNIVDRAEPDDFRRDFIESSTDNEFLIELPRGKYNILVVSGDECEASYTNIYLPHITATLSGKHMKAGFYDCKIIPIMHEKDGLFRIQFRTSLGYKWKLNGIILSREYYM